MIDTLVNLSGLVLIVLIIFWFWVIKPKTLQAVNKRPIEIVVDNGVYTPARIEVPAGQSVTLRFLRKDPSPCAEKVIISDFDISADLPVDKPQDVTFTPEAPGEYDFTCQMQMYRGTLVVK